MEFLYSEGGGNNAFQPALYIALIIRVRGDGYKGI